MSNKNQYFKHIVIWTAVIVFLVTFSVQSYPVIHKGYPPEIEARNLILARNLSYGKSYRMENNLGVLLSSSRVAPEGVSSREGNELTPYIYSWLFRLLGFSYKLPVYITLLLFALANVSFFLISLRLFNFKVALCVSAVYIFLPLIAQGAVIAGFYEFGIFFSSIALLIYLYTDRPNYSVLVFSGLFFALAGFSRNAFFISFIPFLIYDFYRTKSWKRILVFLLPLLILSTIIWLPPYFKSGKLNVYLSSSRESFGVYGHLFPDAYTYFFDRENFLRNLPEDLDPESYEFLIKYGVKVGFKNKIKMYFASARFYPEDSFRLIRLGGALIIGFLILGISYLYKKRNSLLKLFIFWGLSWYLFLIVLKTNNWDHFLELTFPLILMISLGINWLIEILGRLTKGQGRILIEIAVIFLVILHLIQADRWMFSDVYRSAKMDTVSKMVESLKKTDISKEDIIAVNVHPNLASKLNYYLDYNFIFFHPDTIKKLLAAGILKDAFDKFRVTRIFGFDQELGEEIKEKTGRESVGF